MSKRSFWKTFVSKPLFCELKLVASLNGEKALKVDEGADEVEATNAANRRPGRPWVELGKNGKGQHLLFRGIQLN